MNYDDETLMAYADGELDPATRAAIAEAIGRDPALAAAVARHQALRQDVFAAFAGTLEEPVPERLQRTAAGGAQVHDLGAARASRAAERRQPAPARATTWQRWGGMAAMLALGVMAGSLGGDWFRTRQDLPLAQEAGGALSATGRLAQALDRQLAQDDGATGIRVGLSFAAAGGSYCRTFQMEGTAGLACREGGRWHIPVLSESAAEGGAYRQAAAALPQAVLDAVDARIDGPTLDAQAERAARDRSWQPAGSGGTNKKGR